MQITIPPIYEENIVQGLSQEKLQRAFGGEYEKLQHYRLVIDDVGIYNIVCKSVTIESKEDAD